MVQSSICSELDLLLQRVLPLLFKHIKEAQSRKISLQLPSPPQILKKKLSLSCPEIGIPEQLPETLSLLLQYTPSTWHPGFLFKLYSTPDAVGLATELVLSVMNANAHVYAASPVATLMEQHLTLSLGELCGFQNAGGLTCPGGAASNLLASVLARSAHFPNVAQEGWLDQSLADMFVSDHSHYSLSKAAMIMGLGLRQVVAVECDEEGKMIPSALESAINTSLAKNRKPFMVVATSGTTVMGSFDPLEETTKICQKYGLWLHVDGSWGGACIFSEKHRHLLNGLAEADSFTLNAHKLLGVPLQCSILLVKDKETLTRVAGEEGRNYLYHSQSQSQSEDEESGGGGEDLGRLGLGCGRKADAVKFYLTWEYYGRQGFAKSVEKALTMGEYLKARLSIYPEFRLVHPYHHHHSTATTTMNVCFWVIPAWLSELEVKNYEEWTRKLSQTTLKVAKWINQRGSFLVPLLSYEEGWLM